MSGAASSN